MLASVAILGVVGTSSLGTQSATAQEMDKSLIKQDAEEQTVKIVHKKTGELKAELKKASNETTKEVTKLVIEGTATLTKEDWQALQTAFEQFENVENLDISGLTKITEMPENALKEVKWLK